MIGVDVKQEIKNYLNDREVRFLISKAVIEQILHNPEIKDDFESALKRGV